MRRSTPLPPHIHEPVYRLLTAAAAARRTVTYREVAHTAALDTRTDGGRQALAHLLRAISTYEHEQGRPLLTAIVVFDANRRPGAGFFNLAHRLGMSPHDGYPREHWLEHMRFWDQEVQRVYAYWSGRSPTPPT